MLSVISSITSWLGQYLDMLWDLKIPFDDGRDISVAVILIYFFLLNLAYRVVKYVLVVKNGGLREKD